MNKSRTFFVLVFVLAFMAVTAWAMEDKPGFSQKPGLSGPSSASYAIEWSVLPAGGRAMSSASFKVASTAGQASIGAAKSSSYQTGGGFWGAAGVDYTVYLPLVLKNLSQ